MAFPTQSLPDPSNDPVATLTAPGAPYELLTIELGGVPQRVFRHAPQTLGEAYRSLTAFTDRELCIHGERRATYGELLGQAAALSRHLTRSEGIASGTRVALLMRNCPEWLVAFMAITAAGATAVLINPRSTAGEIAAALDDTDSRLVITDEPRARLIGRSGRARPLIALGEPGADCTAFAETIAGWQHCTLEPVPTRPDDAAVVMFTSGTTGGAKAALLSHRGVMTGVINVQFSMAVIGARIDPRRAAAPPIPSALLAAPLFHASGCYSVFLSNLLRGGRIAIIDKWHAERALDLIERERLMAFSGPPNMLWDLVRAHRNGRDLRCLLSIGIASQGFPPPLLEAAAAAFPNAVLGRGYGMTEANGTVCLIAGEELLRRPGASGRVIATADLKLVDDSGREVPPGNTGEICLRGAMLMRGYCGRPEQTAAVLRDGWLFTGDLGRVDADGYLHIIDRKKDIIICGGDKISCSEVEAAVLAHPAVTDAAVFPIADDRLGEIAAVAVVLRDDSAVEAHTLKHHVAVRLSIYKVPRMVMYCSELPRNALGKVMRQELRQRFIELRPHYRPQAEDAASLLAYRDQ